MGTSSSNPGSNSNSPLVPAHANAEPDKPLPSPIPKRFQQFRTNLGKYVKSGDREYLDKSLGNFAHTSTGGADVGPRRYGTAFEISGALISALAGLQAGAEGGDDQTISIAPEILSQVLGQPMDLAVEILADELAPDGEDSDKVRDALICALSESLQDIDNNFDLSLLNEEILSSTLLCYLAEIVFQDIILESGESFDKITSVETIQIRENEIREVIKISVDKHLAKQLENKNISQLTRKELKDVQLLALKEVFAEWESFVQ